MSTMTPPRTMSTAETRLSRRSVAGMRANFEGDAAPRVKLAPGRAGPDRRASVESGPRHSHLRDARQVWLVCGRCRPSWRIADRRCSPSTPYDGIERRADETARMTARTRGIGGQILVRRASGFNDRPVWCRQTEGG
jgi:hypothetical protein